MPDVKEKEIDQPTEEEIAAEALAAEEAEEAAAAEALAAKEELEANETPEEKAAREETEAAEAEALAEEEANAEVVVTLGDEEPGEEAEAAPEWVRELRSSHRELVRENKELKRQNEATQEPTAIVVGKEPSMDDKGIDYDADKFQIATKEYYERKAKADEQTRSGEDDQRKQAEAWQGTLTKYNVAKSELKVPDYDEAEEVAQSELSDVQQGIILHAAANPALLVYALGKNPAKAKEIAAITDNVRFAFAVAKMEAEVKVNKRRMPQPEKKVTGAAQISSNSEATLEKLEKEAERTGNRTKVIAFKRKQKEAA